MSCCNSQHSYISTCSVENAEKPYAGSRLSKRIHYAFLCPPHGIVDKLFTNVLLLFLTWAVPWSILGENCVPGTNIFSIIVVIDVCMVGGVLISKIKLPRLPRLPALLGMLIAGFCMRNIPVINVAKDIDPAWSSALRSIALTVILVKAGLELDASALKKMKGVCIRLTAIPCLVETFTCAVTCKILLGFPWEWGIMMGFVLAAVTPSVIVPCLLSLQDQGYGVDQGIPSLVIAASSFDDVLAISGFSVVLGIAFSQVSSASEVSTTGSNWSLSRNESSTLSASSEYNVRSAGDIAWTVLRGPVEMIAGIILGLLIGAMLWFIPASNSIKKTQNRTIFVLSFAIVALFGSRNVGFPGAGALAAIVIAFTAAMAWEKEKEKISHHVGTLWLLFEPIMFGLIGAEISLESMDAGTIGFGILILFIGLLTRSIATFFAVSCTDLNLKEKLFICFSWIPKATVQAAIGPVALDTARSVSASPEIELLATQVLTIAVLSILVTAPLGATVIGLTGPKLLQHSRLHADDTAAGQVACSEAQDENEKTRLNDEVAMTSQCAERQEQSC